MRRRLVLVATALLTACMSDPASKPTSVSCSAAKNGDACDGSELSCSDPCGSPSPLHHSECRNGHWTVQTYVCDPPPRRDAGVEVGPLPVNDTVGKPCTDTAECDPAETGDSFCSKDGLAIGPIYPTAVCFDGSCNPTLAECANGRGACVPSGVCLPKCTFDTTTVSGCLTGTACFALGGEGAATDGGTTSLGYCLGGCRTDDDCKSVGAACQPESGYCVTKRVTFTKSLGAPCKQGDTSCACHYDVTTKSGYCSQVCRVGESCPIGWLCDSGLPETGPAPPNGLAGWCAQSCTTDEDCSGMTAKCVGSAGLAGKVCRVAHAGF